MTQVSVPVFVKAASIVLVFLAVAVNCGSIHRIERNVPSGNQANLPTTTKAPNPIICSKTIPCGWAVYIPYTRRVDYFMRNTYCDCPPQHGCMRTVDDLTISAFVYHCQPTNKSATTTTTEKSTLVPST